MLFLYSKCMLIKLLDFKYYLCSLFVGKPPAVEQGVQAVHPLQAQEECGGSTLRTPLVSKCEYCQGIIFLKCIIASAH